MGLRALRACRHPARAGCDVHGRRAARGCAGRRRRARLDRHCGAHRADHTRCPRARRGALQCHLVDVRRACHDHPRRHGLAHCPCRSRRSFGRRGRTGRHRRVAGLNVRRAQLPPPLSKAYCGCREHHPFLSFALSPRFHAALLFRLWQGRTLPGRTLPYAPAAVGAPMPPWSSFSALTHSSFALFPSLPSGGLCYNVADRVDNVGENKTPATRLGSGDCLRCGRGHDAGVRHGAQPWFLPSRSPLPRSPPAASHRRSHLLLRYVVAATVSSCSAALSGPHHHGIGVGTWPIFKGLLGYSPFGRLPRAGLLKRDGETAVRLCDASRVSRCTSCSSRDATRSTARSALPHVRSRGAGPFAS